MNYFKLLALLSLTLLITPCFGQYPLLKKRKTHISRIQVAELYPFVTATYKGKTQYGDYQNYVKQGYMFGVGYSFVSAQKFKRIGYGFALEPQITYLESTSLNGPLFRHQDIKLPVMFKISNENKAEFGVYPFFNSFSIGGFISNNISLRDDQEIDKLDYGLSAALEFGLAYVDLKFNYFYSFKPYTDENALTYSRTQVFSFGLMLPLQLKRK